MQPLLKAHVTSCYPLDLAPRILEGKPIRDQILRELRERVDALAARGHQPALAVVLIGDNPASQIYVRNKLAACRELGIRSVEIRLPGDLTTAEVLKRLKPLGEDSELSGVLVQMPLPLQLDAETIVSYAVDPMRDVDGFSAHSLGQLVLNRPGLRACTPLGVMELLRRSDIQIAGRRAVVVGRSDIVGKPMSLLLLHENATVTICHSRTHDLKAECSRADILVAAVGKPAALNHTHIRPGAVVIDVGINRITNRTEAERLYPSSSARMAAFDRTGSVLVGDVDPRAMHELASAYTPVPGGVGPLTIAMLMSNTVTAAEMRWGR